MTDTPLIGPSAPVEPPGAGPVERVGPRRQDRRREREERRRPAGAHAEAEEKTEERRRPADGRLDVLA